MNPKTAIDALIAAGMTEAEIASATGTHQTTINRIRRETLEPRYSVGQALVTLAEAKASDSERPAEESPEARDAA